MCVQIDYTTSEVCNDENNSPAIESSTHVKDNKEAWHHTNKDFGHIQKYPCHGVQDRSYNHQRHVETKGWGYITDNNCHNNRPDSKRKTKRGENYHNIGHNWDRSQREYF